MNRKWFGYLLGMCLLIMLYTVTVMAEENDTFAEEVGSITIVAKEDMTFGIVKVAGILEGQYVLEEQFRDLEIELNEIATAQELQETAEVFRKEIDAAQWYLETKDDGIVVMEDAPLGMYLIYPESVPEEVEVTPALVAVPGFDEALKDMNYDVEVLLKVSSVLPEKTYILKAGEVVTGVDYGEFRYIVICIFMAFVTGILIVRCKRI